MFKAKLAQKGQKVPNAKKNKNFKAKSDQKVPNLTYLALRKVKWQPWTGSAFNREIFVNRLIEQNVD